MGVGSRVGGQMVYLMVIMERQMASDTVHCACLALVWSFEGIHLLRAGQPWCVVDWAQSNHQLTSKLWVGSTVWPCDRWCVTLLLKVEIFACVVSQTCSHFCHVCLSLCSSLKKMFKKRKEISILGINSTWLMLKIQLRTQQQLRHEWPTVG